MNGYSFTQIQPHAQTNLELIQSLPPNRVATYLIHYDHFDERWHDFMDYKYKTYQDAIDAMVAWLGKEAVSWKE